MRVTSNTFPTELSDQIQDLREKQFIYQRNISSGKKIHNPSDDPTGYRRSIEIQSDQRLQKQFHEVIRQMKLKTEASYQASVDLQTVVTRATEITVRANNTLQPADMQALAVEVDSLLERALSLGNKQSNGQFIFGGTYLQPTDLDGAALYVPFRATRNGSNQITGVTYRGNEIINRVQIDVSSTFDANILGSSASGTPRGLFINNTTNVYNTLISLRDSLNAGSVNQNTLMTAFRSIEDNIAAVVGSTSASLSRLQVSEAAINTYFRDSEANLSNYADANVADTILELQKAESALQASLATGSRVLNLSLLDYL